MATLQEIRNKADAKLVDIWNILLPKEQAYYAKYGRYFGMNWSPVLKVVDGVDTNFVLNPPSKFFEAADVDFDAGVIPFQIKIICHDGPDGKGFTAWVKVELLNGDTYQRAKGYGFYGETIPWSKEIFD